MICFGTRLMAPVTCHSLRKQLDCDKKVLTIDVSTTLSGLDFECPATHKIPMSQIVHNSVYVMSHLEGPPPAVLLVLRNASLLLRCPKPSVWSILPLSIEFCDYYYCYLTILSLIAGPHALPRMNVPDSPQSHTTNKGGTPWTRRHVRSHCTVQGISTLTQSALASPSVHNPAQKLQGHNHWHH